MLRRSALLLVLLAPALCAQGAVSGQVNLLEREGERSEDLADVIVWLDISLLATIGRRIRGLSARQLSFETPQIWWQIRWYLRRYRPDQDIDRLPSASAIRHFLKPRMDKVRRYRRNPSVEAVEAMIRCS